MSFLDDLVQAGSDAADSIGLGDVFGDVVSSAEDAAGQAVVTAAQGASAGQQTQQSPPKVPIAPKAALGFPVILIGGAALWYLFSRK